MSMFQLPRPASPIPPRTYCRPGSSFPWVYEVAVFGSFRGCPAGYAVRGVNLPAPGRVSVGES